MDLHKYVELAERKVRCVFCAFSDQYEDMIESDGKFMHQECLSELQSIAQGDQRDNHNGDHRLEMEQ